MGLSSDLQTCVWKVLCIPRVCFSPQVSGGFLALTRSPLTTCLSLQIDDIADGAVKPPPNKYPIFFFGTHET